MSTVRIKQVDEAAERSIEDALRSYSEVTANLLASYDALEARAARVEEKLAVTNRALEAKVAELDAVLASLPVGVVVRDAAGRVTRANSRVAETLGLDERALLGAEEIELFETIAAATEGSRVTCADGAERVLSLRRSPVRSGAGRTLGTVEIVDEHTELAELTERVHAMDKVAALGTMAGGIAHEIRNPLNAVAGFAQLLTERVRRSETIDDPKLERFSEAIAQGAAEADAIISSLMTISTPERLDRDRIVVRGLLDEAIAAALESNEAIVDEYGAPVVHVHCEVDELIGDHIKLRQAVRNLVSNAIQAAPGQDLVAHAIHDQDRIVLAIDDAGPGIPADLRRRILDPFFTTRAEGTGLGLALANTIADLHGGQLEIQPTPSELGGARVAIHLPHSPANRR